MKRMHDDGYHRPDWRCRGCVVIIIMMTVGDAEDARCWLSSMGCTMMVIVDDDNGDDEIGDAKGA